MRKFFNFLESETTELLTIRSGFTAEVREKMCWSKQIVSWCDLISISKAESAFGCFQRAPVDASVWTRLRRNKHIMGSRRRPVHPARLMLPPQRPLLKKDCQISILTRLFSPQEYQIDIIFAQTWVDTRLRYNSSSSMPTLTLNRYTGFSEDVLKTQTASCLIPACQL